MRGVHAPGPRGHSGALRCAHQPRGALQAGLVTLVLLRAAPAMGLMHGEALIAQSGVPARQQAAQRAVMFGSVRRDTPTTLPATGLSGQWARLVPACAPVVQRFYGPLDPPTHPPMPQAPPTPTTLTLPPTSHPTPPLTLPRSPPPLQDLHQGHPHRAPRPPLLPHLQGKGVRLLV